MSCSPAQLKSNRKNSKNSTGPRTAQGKSRSRGNAVKHGLSGAGICLPTEDARELDVRFDAMAESLKPQDERQRVMTCRASLLALRLDRCATAETHRTSLQIRQAMVDYDEQLMSDVRGTADGFPSDPAGTVRRLKRTAQGVDFLVEHWQELRDAAAARGSFTSFETSRAEQLLGRWPDSTTPSPILDMARGAAYGKIEEKTDPTMTPDRLDANKAWALGRLDELLGEMIDRLEAHRLTLPHADAQLNRLEAPLRAVVDLSPAGIILRRYETAAARELHKIFASFDAWDAQAEADDLAATPVEDETSGELASFRNSPEPDPAEPSTEPIPEPENLVEAVLTPLARLDRSDSTEFRPVPRDGTHLEPEGRPRK